MKNLKGAKVLKPSIQKMVSGGGLKTCVFSADDTTDWCCHLPQGCP